MRQIYLFILAIFLLLSCSTNKNKRVSLDCGVTKVEFRYAQNLAVEKGSDYITVRLLNPWKDKKVLHTYYIVDRGRDVSVPDDGTKVYRPLQRSVVFTSAHANLFEMLNASNLIAGVADLKYMLIPDIQKRVKQSNGIVDCGEAMNPNIEKIIDLSPDAIFLSPYENSGGYGRLESLGVPLIECADYMETSALGRAEWMKFYGILMGKEREADSLFSIVEQAYNRLKTLATTSKEKRSILPDRKVGAVWYLPGGKSSVGLLYKDANGVYALGQDQHSGSLTLPFEEVLAKFENSDFWVLSYNGNMNLKSLVAEYEGYKLLKPFQTREVYGCKVDSIPYFEEVSWRPDWLLSDLIQLFHHDLKLGTLKYYKRLQ